MQLLTTSFLPYTARFDVGSQSALDPDSRAESAVSEAPNTGPRGPESGLPAALAPINISKNSILPSLSIANSQSHTPASGSPKNSDAPLAIQRPASNRGSFNEHTIDPSAVPLNAAEEFFYHRHKPRKPGDGHSSPLVGDLTDGSTSQLIQPKARYNSPFPVLVVDEKRANDDHGFGLPALKINRSTTNLLTLGSFSNLSNLSSGVHTPAASGNRPGVVRARTSLSRQLPGFLLKNDNTSASSLAFVEDEEPTQNEPDDWANNFNDMINGRSYNKLAPFGGFSRPGLEAGLLQQENIFESAPWKITLTGTGNVSLVKAVKLSVESGIIEKRKWIGTISMPSDEVPKHVMDSIADTLSADYNCEAVFPNDITFLGHYKSFCKQILWPTLHYQIPDDPKSKAFEDHSWGHYRLLNQIVADKVVEVYQKENGDLSPDDPENIIWVHDYHLLLVPKMVREKLPNAKIGLFLHVSFPSSEVFRCFAQRKALLEGMLGASCITFQNEEYVRHFLQTCNRLLLADTNEFGITYDGKFTMINFIPVGIDAKSVSDLFAADEVKEWRQMIRDRWGTQNLIVSRDKLDRLRGIKQKLLAYEKFLHNYPEYVESTVLIQICIGSGHDSEYETEIMQIVSRINALTENISVSQPVVLLQRDIDFEQYLALQGEADIFVVSSMREGLNLTCHEFVMATSEKKSPLMLSEFTGSSNLMYHNGKGALLVNPWDTKEFGETFLKALTMSKDEKLVRWKNEHETVLKHDSNNWVDTCLSSINESWERDQRRNSTSLYPFSSAVFEHFYSAKEPGSKRLFFLNLETASPITAIYDNKSNQAKVSATIAASTKSAFSEPSRISSLLSDLLSDPSNHVYLISFMKRNDLDALYRTVPNLGLIAENGGYIKFVSSKKWVSIVDESEVKRWMPQVSRLVQSKAERLPGAHCEVEDCTVRFHPGTAFTDDRARSLDVMGDCIQHINDVYQELDGVHASLIKNVVVVQQNQLALKAIKFIIAYYNQQKEGTPTASLIEQYQVKQVPNYGSVPTSPVAEINNPSSMPLSPISGRLATEKVSSQSSVSTVFFSGGSTLIDEPIFEYVNSLKTHGDVPNVLTITMLGADVHVRTSAHFGSSGKNELLGVLSKAHF